MGRGWRRYLKRLPLLHRQLRAVPRYEIIHAAVEPLGWDWAAISAERATLVFYPSDSVKQGNDLFF